MSYEIFYLSSYFIMTDKKCCNRFPMSKKGGAGVRRILMTNLHPVSTLDNHHVPGSGVGAVSTANRRALQRRAAWKPHVDNKPKIGQINSVNTKKPCLANCFKK